MELMVRVVSSGQATGELSDRDPPEVVAEDLLLASRGYVLYWCEQGGSFELLPAFRNYLRRLLRGYLGPRARGDIKEDPT